MISYRYNYTAIIAILASNNNCASSHNITRDIILGTPGNESATNDDIRGLTNGKAPFASPVLITESDNDLKQHYQRDPTNVYQRYSWDGYFCSTGLFGREFLTKIMFNRDTAIYYKFMDLVCEQFAQVGMRMVAALAEDGWSMTWPWPKFLTVNREFVTDMNDQTIEYSKEVMGRDDWRISAVVAHVNPETYKVIKFEFTEDFEIMWEGSKANKLSLPLKVIADFDIMDRLNMDSPEYSAPLTAKLKTLSADLLSLIGHSQGKLFVVVKLYDMCFHRSLTILLHRLR